MARSVVIDERFCGPPGIGNGGYVAGRLALTLAGAPERVVEVTLRRGNPLAERTEGDGLRVMPGPVSADLLAAAWVPDAALADADGRLAAIAHAIWIELAPAVPTPAPAR